VYGNPGVSLLTYLLQLLYLVPQVTRHRWARWLLVVVVVVVILFSFWIRDTYCLLSKLTGTRQKQLKHTETERSFLAKKYTELMLY